jgi:hypothetical protein
MDIKQLESKIKSESKKEGEITIGGPNLKGDIAFVLCHNLH